MAQPLYELPEGWLAKPIGEIASLVTKGSTPTSYGHKFQDSGINFVKIENITAGKIDADRITSFITEEAHQFLKRSQLKEGDLLFSIAGSIGTSALVDASILPANTNQALALIRGYESDAIPEFLLYALRSEVLNETKNKKRGGALQNISLTDIKNTKIPLPPLNEQKRIVAKLDALFTRIDAAITHLQETLELSKALFASALDEAFDTSNCSSKTVEDVASLISGQHLKKDEYTDFSERGSIPYLTGPAEFGVVSPNPSRWTKERRSIATAGDALITVKGSGVGKVNLANEPEIFISRQLMAVRAGTSVTSDYLYLFFQARQRVFAEKKTGAAIPGIGRKDVLSQPIPCPNLEEQERVVEGLNQLSESTRTLEAETQERLDQLATLKSSLLNSAFRGQL